MVNRTPAQDQIVKEMQALVNAWTDRGILVRDVVPLFATYLVATALDTKALDLEKVLELIARLWIEFSQNTAFGAPLSSPTAKGNA